MIKRFYLIAGVLIASWIASGQATDKLIKASDFSGVSIDGEQIKLSDYAGKVVLIDFWAAWCGPCRKEMPFLVEQYETKKNLDFVVLAVNLDKDIKNMNKFLNDLEKAPAFPILRDPEEFICSLFDLQGMPTSVLIDRKGNIRFRHVGFKDKTREELLHEIDLLIAEKEAAP